MGEHYRERNSNEINNCIIFICILCEYVRLHVKLELFLIKTKEDDTHILTFYR